MKYGYFDDRQCEYVITEPKTPTPWINYLGNQSFYSLVSNTGGGFSYFCDAKLMRITRYRYNSLPLDLDGKYIFIKDETDVWNPTFKPTQTKLDLYECHVGMGYNIFVGKKNGLTAKIRNFVPLDAPCEVQELTITNETDRERKIQLYSYVEWCLWDAIDDMSNFQRNLNIGEMMVEDSAIYHLTEYRERRRHFAFYVVNSEIQGYDVNRDSFVGAYRSLENPQAIENGRCSNSSFVDGYPIAAHQIDVTLQPGETKTYVYMLGYVENEKGQKWESDGVVNREKAKALQDAYLNPERVETEFQKLREYWMQLLGNYQVSTKDEHINRMVNIWNQYQCVTTFRVCRTASFYESGLGRQIGFRDSCQDLLGFIHVSTEEAKERLLNIAAIQKEDGSAYHQYQPLTKKGNVDIGTGFNDDPLWLVAAISAYLRETGDFSLLKEVVPYADSEQEDTIFAHMKKAFEYITEHLGPHGLPQIGRADWNDCLNLNCSSEEPGESFQITGPSEGPIAESVFIAGMYVKYGKEYANILRALDMETEALRVDRLIEQMEHAINTAGWDGEWFVRAYDAQGNKVGSNSCEEGKIYIEPQGFCVMGGVGIENGKAEKALSSVKKYLDTPYGIMLHQPPYTKYHVELGEITSYPPGAKENGSVFCHSNPWVVIAETMLDHGEQAMEYYYQLCPSVLEKISEVHKTEPYVYSQTVAGKDSKLYGSARNSWLTGTASWSFVSISQYILGIYPDLEGLQIRPCVPSGFGDFTVVRYCRGKKYNIFFKEAVDYSEQEGKLLFNGKDMKACILPWEEALESNEVIVYY